MLNVYGLKNCDTCRKALKWMDANGVAHTFLDVRKDGVTAADIARWAAAVGVDVLLNKRGTTWRGLDDAVREEASSTDGAVKLMAEHPALIKRPVFDDGKTVMVGFTKDVEAALSA